MARPKITDPVTPNAERAQRENNRREAPPDKGHGSPSRAHTARGGGHEKSVSRSAPKSGGRPRGNS